MVTGAAGFIGSHLADALLARGETVIGLDNFEPSYPRPIKEQNLRGAIAHNRFEMVEGEITDLALLSDLIGPDTTVVHLAARAGVRPSIADPLGYARTNVVGTATVAEAVRRAGATRLVFASSSSVYGDDTPAPFREDAPALRPVSPYAATKRAAELHLIAGAPLTGLRVAALRYFTVFGPRQRPDLAIHTFAAQMRAGAPVTLSGGDGSARDYTYVSDIVAGTLAAIAWTATAEPGVEIFNLGGGRPVPLPRVVEVLGRVLGVTPDIRREPGRPGDVTLTSADLGKSARLLGYHPTVSFDEGIARYVAWLEESHGHQH
jgi:UDP-glucuronate 4-epimerase